MRWQPLVDSAVWVFNEFGEQLARAGWSGLDVFGILESGPGWGGLVDRIGESRNLKVLGERAVWSSWGVKDWTCRGAGDALVPSGLVLLWKVGDFGSQSPGASL